MQAEHTWGGVQWPAHLAHEVWDDAVEGAALVAEALLAGAQRPEVLGRLGHHVGAQLGNKRTGSARQLPAGKQTDMVSMSAHS